MERRFTSLFLKKQCLALNPKACKREENKLTEIPLQKQNSYKFTFHQNISIEETSF